MLWRGNLTTDNRTARGREFNEPPQAAAWNYFRALMDELRAIDPLGAGWLAGVVLLACGALAWVNLTAPKQWEVLLHSFASVRLGKQRVRAELDLSDRNLALLLLTAILLIGVFAYEVSYFQGWGAAGLPAFGQVLLVTAIVVVAQMVLLRVIGSMAGADGGLEEYLRTVVVLNVGLGLALLPLAVAMAWPAWVAWRTPVCIAGLMLAVAVLLFRWVRAVAIGLGHGTPVRYVFIYLCAAEAMPFALALHYAGFL